MPPKSVLCNLLYVIHFSTFAPASGRFAPLHGSRTCLSSVLCTLYSVLFSASYLAFSNDRSASSFSVGIRVR